VIIIAELWPDGISDQIKWKDCLHCRDLRWCKNYLLLQYDNTL
jgi:hypothetical protein